MRKLLFSFPSLSKSLIIAKSVIGNLISAAAVDLLGQSSWAKFDTAPPHSPKAAESQSALPHAQWFFGPCRLNSPSVRF